MDMKIMKKWIIPVKRKRIKNIYDKQSKITLYIYKYKIKS